MINERDERERVPCPYCAEYVLKEARVCKHCGKSIEHDSLSPSRYENESTDIEMEEKKEVEETQEENSKYASSKRSESKITRMFKEEISLVWKPILIVGVIFFPLFFFWVPAYLKWKKTVAIIAYSWMVIFTTLVLLPEADKTHLSQKESSEKNAEITRDIGEKSVSANSGDSVSNAFALCQVMDSAGVLSKDCEVSGWNKSVDLTIDTNAREAMKICRGISDLARKNNINFNKGWKVRIYSPFSNDNTTANCSL